MQLLRPFQRLRKLTFRSRSPLGIYLLCENCESQDILLKLRKQFPGTWYYLWTRQIRLLGHYKQLTPKQFRWVRKLRLTPLLIDNLRYQKYCIFDLSYYFAVLENTQLPYYNRRFVIQLPELFGVFKNRKSILLYVLDVNNAGPTNIRRSKLYPILRFIEKSNYKLFDTLIITVVSNDNVIFIPTIVDGDTTYVRKTVALLRRLIRLCKQQNITSAIQDTLSHTSLAKLVAPKTLASTIVSVNPALTSRIDIETTIDKIVDSIVPERNRSPESVSRSLQSLVPREVITADPSDNLITQIVSSPIVSAHVTNTLHNYRRLDLSQIIRDVFTLLDTYRESELGVKILDWKIKDLPLDTREIAPSLVSEVSIKLQTKADDKVHNLRLRIPRQLPDGSLLIYGNRYVIVNQIYPVPITFPKPGQARFSSFTTTFFIEKQKTKTVIYIQGSRLPITIVLCYFYDLHSVLSRYKITYEITNEPAKNENDKSFKLPNGKYLLVVGYTYLDDIQKDLLDNLFKFKGLEQIEAEPLTKEYFEKFIQLYTGDEQLPERISNSLKTALDAKTVDILREKGFPTNLFDIFKYMHYHVLKGTTSPRNDLVETRLRANEILTHITFDVLKSALYDYNRQRKYGKAPKLRILPDKVLAEVVTSASCQLMEFVNPIEEASQYFKVTYAGYKGIPKDAVPSQVRTLHPSNFGVTDPVDVPLGDSIGVVQHLTTDLVLTRNGSIVPKVVTDKVGSNILSVAAMSVPFISRNEPTRTMMAANQSKQAVLLKEPHIPLIQTGIESLLPRILPSETFVKKSPCTGTVIDVNNSAIALRCESGKTQVVDLEPKKARSGQGYSSLVTYKPRVTKGSKVRANQIIATSNACKDGIVSTGRNCVCSYMFYKGYTYEDGVVISETLSKDLTSTHLVDYKMFVDEADRLIYVSDKLRRGQRFKAGEEMAKAVGSKFLDLLDLGLIDVESFVQHGNRYSLVAPYDCTIHNVEIALSGIELAKLPSDVIETLKSLQVDLSPKEPYLYKGSRFRGVYIRVDVVFEKPMQVGDKLTNRAASKGVVCKILPVEQMPQLPDGRHVEVIFAPLTFINRTNVAQLYELYVGEIAYKYGQMCLKLSRKAFIERLKLLRILDDKYYIPKLIDFLIKCSDKQYKEFQRFVKENRGIPIVVPQFAEPTYKQILQVMKALKIPPKYNLKLSDGSTVTAPTGMLYILKLEHMVSHKIFSRSIGPYQSKTGQPTRGKSKGGGQRLGEGDSWSLAAWGAENLLKECFSASADDFKLKQQVYRQIIQTGSASLETLLEGSQVTKDLVRNMMRGMCLEI